MQYQVPTALTAQVRKMAVPVTGIDQWPAASIAKIFEYGFQQLLNDAAAPAKSTDEVLPLVQKRIANLAAGILRASPVRLGDPVAREARRIAEERVDAAIKASAKTVTKENRKALIAKLAAREDILATARANVEAVADLDIDVDLGDEDDLVADADDESDEEDQDESEEIG